MTTPRPGPGSAQAEPLDPCDRPAHCRMADNEERQERGAAPAAGGVLAETPAATGQAGPTGTGTNARDRSHQALEDADIVVQRSLHAMRLALERLEAGKGTAADVVAEGAVLRRAFLTLFEERKRLAQFSPAGGRVGDGAGVSVPTLDLAAARAEIGRRLDRLRAAGGGDGVS